MTETYLVCRNDVEFLKRHKVEYAFFLGSTSTYRVHICQHYEYYRQRCRETGVKEQDHTLPRDVFRAKMKAAEEAEKVQMRVDDFM